MNPQATLELKPTEPTLDFEPNQHAYRLLPEGIRLPSVTQILTGTRMIDYSMIPASVLFAAQIRGTAVHEALHYLDDGELDQDTLDPAIHGYVMAYLAFKNQAQFTPALVEYRNWHRAYRYAGTLDRMGTILRSDGGVDLVVLDFKTGEVQRGHALQLAAYTDCLPEPRKYRRMALQLSSDGTFKVHEFKQVDFRRDMDLFLSALNCYRWQTGL